MLRRPFSHPLDIFIQDDSLFMMEAMLPFLDPQIMKPMAIYIKFTEMMIILNNINNQDYMRRCCFHKDINNYDAVLSSLKDMGMAEDIEQAMRMKSAMDMMQRMNNTHSRLTSHIKMINMIPDNMIVSSMKMINTIPPPKISRKRIIMTVPKMKVTQSLTISWIS